MYHAQVSHISYKEAFMPGASINKLIEFGEPERGLQYSSPERGHGAGWFTYPDEASMHQMLQSATQEVIDHTRNVLYPQVSERLGETRGQKMGIFHMTVFPNMSLNRAQGYLRLWQPVSPTETEVWSFVFVDADMPEEVKKGYLTSKANVFSVAGALEQDDAENTVASQMGLTGAKASKTRA